MYKFQKLKVYQKGLEYLDLLYGISEKLPEDEKYNLKSQLLRAGTSIVLNIAEGSTGQSDLEQSRFLSIAIAMRSYLETVSCLDIAELRKYFTHEKLKAIRAFGHNLFISLVAFRKSLKNNEYKVSDGLEKYSDETGD